ncbi:MAG: hypothetical protein QGI58_04000 [Candidatus Thalassarchaeaceae archaeon]|nr:hypothetical protein [Candidatus Thalassarchaeaceae archaeon]
MLRSRRAVAIFVLMMLISSSQVAIANSTGKTGQSTAGCTCHSASASISPSLSGLPWGAGGYTPGTTYSLTWDGGPHVSGEGGFNLDASAGTWSNLGSQVQLVNGELTHSSDSLRSWSADWTAPSAGSGDVDFDLAVLYANGNGANSGDSWGTGTWTLGEDSSGSNTPPEAHNVTLVPTDPTKGTGLAVDYTYYDYDGNSEQGTQIRWTLDSLSVGALDDQNSVGQSWLTKGQEWTCTVTVKDGSDAGEPVTVGPVTIGNSLPIARSLELTPENPLDTDELRLDYDYFDLDGEPQQDTQIRWYLDGARIPELDDSDRVSSLMIRSGDQWEASVLPHDGDEFGEIVYTGVVVIGSSNNPPSATAYVSPVGNAQTDDALQVHVGWTDPDGDSVQATEIRWLRDGTQVSAYNDLTVVMPESTAKGEIWVARARVNDGFLWSEWVESGEVNILNTPPEVTSIEMLPAGTLTTSMNLSVVWEQSDVDGDAEMNSQIRWWVNGEWIRQYDGMLEIPSSETVRDQSWSVQVVPGDGDDLGDSMKTTSRQIENGAPGEMVILLGNGESGYAGAPSASAAPPTTPADSLSPLVVHTTAVDLDGEPVSFHISWARNGFTVPDLDDSRSVPADRLEPGQTWTTTVTASDPWGVSSEIEAEITIANVPPTALFTISPEPPIAGAFITLDASISTDLDGKVTHYLWEVDGVSLTGKTVNVQLGTGSHSVILTVVDDMGGTGFSASAIVFGEVSTVTSLNATLSGNEVQLSWEWDGDATTFRIYRSTSAFTSIGHGPAGEALLTGLEAVGETDEKMWSETAPVAAHLHYAVTLEVEGLEVLWLFQLDNTATVDASDAPSSVDTEPTGSMSSMSIPLTLIMLLVGLASIGLTMYGRRRDA